MQDVSNRVKYTSGKITISILHVYIRKFKINNIILSDLLWVHVLLFKNNVINTHTGTVPSYKSARKASYRKTDIQNISIKTFWR